MKDFCSNDEVYRTERVKSKMLALLLMFNSYIGLFRFITYKTVHNSTLGTIFYLAIVLLCTFSVLLNNIDEKLVKKTIKWILLYVLFIVTMYLLFPINRKYFKEYSNDLILNIVVGCVGAAIISELRFPELLYKELLPHLRVLSLLLPLIYLLGASYYYTGMEWGSRMYPIALWYYLCIKGLKEHTQFDKLIVLLAVAFSLLGGRQSLIFLVFGILAVFFLSGKLDRNKIFIIMLLLFGLMFTVVFYNDLLQLLKFALDRLNINSRSLSMLSNQSLLDISNRKSIYYRCKEIIGQNGMSVSGMFADRYYLRQYRSNIAYAHNLFYELLIDFGTLGGSCIIIVGAYKWIRGSIKTYKANRSFFIVLSIIGIARCFVSSSVFIEVGVLFFIGLLMNPYLCSDDSYNSKKSEEIKNNDN